MRILGEGLWQQRVFGREMKICLYFSLFLFDGISFGFSFFYLILDCFLSFFVRCVRRYERSSITAFISYFLPSLSFPSLLTPQYRNLPHPVLKRQTKYPLFFLPLPFFTRSRNHNLPQVGPKTRAQKYPPSAIIESGAAAKKGSGAVIMIHGGSGATWLGGNEDARGAREL